MSEPLVQITGLTHRYPDGHRALDGIDLVVHAGERVALLGPNGSGKTTLALHLNGILTPTSGVVTVSGLDVARNVREVRRRVGLVFQDTDDQLFMPTVRQDVAFGPANFGLSGDALDERVNRALASVDMLDCADRVPSRLSGGQRRRVALATVLATDPDLLVLDEPTANLDPVARRDLLRVLEPLPVTILLVTHDLPFAAQLCARSAIIDDGRVVADGPTAELLSDGQMLAHHRLELPFGFDHSALTN